MCRKFDDSVGIVNPGTFARHVVAAKERAAGHDLQLK